MKTIQKLAFSAMTVVVLVSTTGCEGMSRQDKSAVIGAGAGAVGGAVLTGGSTLGTVGGAAVGGLIGNEVGKDKK